MPDRREEILGLVGTQSERDVRLKRLDEAEKQATKEAGVKSDQLELGLLQELLTRNADKFSISSSQIQSLNTDLRKAATDHDKITKAAQAKIKQAEGTFDLDPTIEASQKAVKEYDVRRANLEKERQDTIGKIEKDLSRGHPGFIGTTDAAEIKFAQERDPEAHNLRAQLVQADRFLGYRDAVEALPADGLNGIRQRAKENGFRGKTQLADYLSSIDATHADHASLAKFKEISGSKEENQSPDVAVEFLYAEIIKADRAEVDLSGPLDIAEDNAVRLLSEGGFSKNVEAINTIDYGALQSGGAAIAGGIADLNALGTYLANLGSVDDMDSTLVKIIKGLHAKSPGHAQDVFDHAKIAVAKEVSYGARKQASQKAGEESTVEGASITDFQSVNYPLQYNGGGYQAHELTNLGAAIAQHPEHALTSNGADQASLKALVLALHEQPGNDAQAALEKAQAKTFDALEVSDDVLNRTQDATELSAAARLAEAMNANGGNLKENIGALNAFHGISNAHPVAVNGHNIDNLVGLCAAAHNAANFAAFNPAQGQPNHNPALTERAYHSLRAIYDLVHDANPIYRDENAAFQDIRQTAFDQLVPDARDVAAVDDTHGLRGVVQNIKINDISKFLQGATTVGDTEYAGFGLLVAAAHTASTNGGYEAFNVNNQALKAGITEETYNSFVALHNFSTRINALPGAILRPIVVVFNQEVVPAAMGVLETSLAAPGLANEAFDNILQEKDRLIEQELAHQIVLSNGSLKAGLDGIQPFIGVNTAIQAGNVDFDHLVQRASGARDYADFQNEVNNHPAFTQPVYETLCAVQEYVNAAGGVTATQAVDNLKAAALDVALADNATKTTVKSAGRKVAKEVGYTGAAKAANIIAQANPAGPDYKYSEGFGAVTALMGHDTHVGGANIDFEALVARAGANERYSTFNPGAAHNAALTESIHASLRAIHGKATESGVTAEQVVRQKQLEIFDEIPSDKVDAAVAKMSTLSQEVMDLLAAGGNQGFTAGVKADGYTVITQQRLEDLKIEYLNQLIDKDDRDAAAKRLAIGADGKVKDPVIHSFIQADPVQVQPSHVAGFERMEYLYDMVTRDGVDYLNLAVGNRKSFDHLAIAMQASPDTELPKGMTNQDRSTIIELYNYANVRGVDTTTVLREAQLSRFAQTDAKAQDQAAAEVDASLLPDGARKAYDTLKTAADRYHHGDVMAVIEKFEVGAKRRSSDKAKTLDEKLNKYAKVVKEPKSKITDLLPEEMAALDALVELGGGRNNLAQGIANLEKTVLKATHASINITESTRASDQARALKTDYEDRLQAVEEECRTYGWAGYQAVHDSAKRKKYAQDIFAYSEEGGANYRESAICEHFSAQEMESIARKRKGRGGFINDAEVDAARKEVEASEAAFSAAVKQYNDGVKGLLRGAGGGAIVDQIEGAAKKSDTGIRHDAIAQERISEKARINMIDKLVAAYGTATDEAAKDRIYRQIVRLAEHQEEDTITEKMEQYAHKFVEAVFDDKKKGAFDKDQKQEFMAKIAADFSGETRGTHQERAARVFGSLDEMGRLEEFVALVEMSGSNHAKDKAPERLQDLLLSGSIDSQVFYQTALVDVVWKQASETEKVNLFNKALRSQSPEVALDWDEKPVASGSLHDVALKVLQSDQQLYAAFFANTRQEFESISEAQKVAASAQNSSDTQQTTPSVDPKKDWSHSATGQNTPGGDTKQPSSGGDAVPNAVTGSFPRSSDATGNQSNAQMLSQAGVVQQQGQYPYQPQYGAYPQQGGYGAYPQGGFGHYPQQYGGYGYPAPHQVGFGAPNPCMGYQPPVSHYNPATVAGAVSSAVSKAIQEALSGKNLTSEEIGAVVTKVAAAASEAVYSATPQPPVYHPPYNHVPPAPYAMPPVPYYGPPAHGYGAPPQGFPMAQPNYGQMAPPQAQSQQQGGHANQMPQQPMLQPAPQSNKPSAPSLDVSGQDSDSAKTDKSLPKSLVGKHSYKDIAEYFAERKKDDKDVFGGFMIPEIRGANGGKRKDSAEVLDNGVVLFKYNNLSDFENDLFKVSGSAKGVDGNKHKQLISFVEIDDPENSRRSIYKAVTISKGKISSYDLSEKDFGRFITAVPQDVASSDESRAAIMEGALAELESHETKQTLNDKAKERLWEKCSNGKIWGFEIRGNPFGGRRGKLKNFMEEAQFTACEDRNEVVVTRDTRNPHQYAVTINNTNRANADIPLGYGCFIRVLADGTVDQDAIYINVDKKGNKERVDISGDMFRQPLSRKGPLVDALKAHNGVNLHSARDMASTVMDKYNSLELIVYKMEDEKDKSIHTVNFHVNGESHGLTMSKHEKIASVVFSGAVLLGTAAASMGTVIPAAIAGAGIGLANSAGAITGYTSAAYGAAFGKKTVDQAGRISTTEDHHKKKESKSHVDQLADRENTSGKMGNNITYR